MAKRRNRIGTGAGSVDVKLSRALWLRNAPPAALAAMERANLIRAGETRGERPPSSTMDETPMPPNATAKPSAAKSNEPSVAGHRRWKPQPLKCFDSEAEAYDVGMVLRAGALRGIGARDLGAEAHCKSRKLALFSTATTLNPAAGEYLVPDELSRAIIKRMNRVGATRRLAFVSPMGSKIQQIPVELGGLHVQYIPEAQAPAVSDLELGAVGLHAEKRGVLGYISRELQDDALISWTDHYVDRAAHALAKQQDRELILADGTSAFGNEVGLLASIGSAGVHGAAAGHDTFAELDLEDYLATMALLPEAFDDGRASWITSAAGYALGMLGSVNGVAQGFAPDGRPLFLGRPVDIVQGMPASAASTIAALYGSWSEAIILGDRSLTFKVSDQTPEAFDRDLIAIFCTARYDLAIVNAGDAVSAGAYVGLRTAA